jgi:hypothetical protein
MSQVKRRPRLVTAFALALAVVFGAASAVVATTFVRSGKSITAVKAATNDTTQVVTYSAGLADVTGMNVTVTVPSGQKALFVVTFSADALTNADCDVQATINGQTLVPGVADFMNNQIALESMQWIAGPEAAGSYTFKIRVQEVINFDAGYCNFQQRTLVVERAVAS